MVGREVKDYTGELAESAEIFYNEFLCVFCSLYGKIVNLLEDG